MCLVYQVKTSCFFSTHHLDADTEYEIMSHLRSLKDHITIIAITHNIKLIHSEDTVIKLT